MVTKKLQDFNRNSEDATELSQEIKALKITKLHKASESTVNTLLSQVLHDVERLIVVPIHAWHLVVSRWKKHQHKPLKYTEDEGWKTSSKIRESFPVVKDKIQAPKSWLYHDLDGSILWLIYTTSAWVEALIKREIADHPVWAEFLRNEMSKKSHKK
jgi:hypothetical protein